MPEVLKPVDSGPGERVYRTPARELSRPLEVDAASPLHAEPGPWRETASASRGEASGVAGARGHSDGPGRAVLVPAALASCSLRATAALPRARPGLEPAWS